MHGWSIQYLVDGMKSKNAWNWPTAAGDELGLFQWAWYLWLLWKYAATSWVLWLRSLVRYVLWWWLSRGAGTGGAWSSSTIAPPPPDDENVVCKRHDIYAQLLLVAMIALPVVVSADIYSFSLFLKEKNTEKNFVSTCLTSTVLYCRCSRIIRICCLLEKYIICPLIYLISPLSKKKGA